MSGARSVTGCWTCRLRRKKCDEKTPRCAVCASHDLPCHGYGPKPSFMDRGDKERIERQKVKTIVAQHTARRRAEKMERGSEPRLSSVSSPSNESVAEEVILGTVQIDNGLPSSPIAKSGVLNNNGTVILCQNEMHPSNDTLDDESPSPSWVTSYSYLSETLEFPDVPGFSSKSDESMPSPNKALDLDHYDTVTAVNTQGPQKSTPDTSTLVRTREHEATLLMHYLDRVFPLQYRFYRPSETDDGRGWLLALLTRTKPLYHAALSLSALHLQVLQNIRAREHRVRPAETSVELYQHYDLALKELQHYIQLEQQSEDVNGKLQVLACTVQFISFELCRGGTYNWQPHLHAAAAIASVLIPRYLPGPGQRIEDSVLKSTDTAISFMCGVVLWMDTLSTITTGRRSLLFDQHDRLLASVEMEKIVGCRNWVIACINEISRLADLKNNTQNGISQKTWGFISSAQILNDRLQSGLKEITLEAEILKGRQPFRGTEDYDAYIACVITRVYAAAALVYLQTIAWGAHHTMPEIESAVNLAIMALKEVPEPQMARSLIWPLVITACMAGADHQTFFEDKIFGGGRAGLEFGNSSQGLAVMRKCWELRALSSESDGIAVDWMTAMRSLDIQLLCV